MDYHIIPVMSGTIRKTKVYSAQLAQITPKGAAEGSGLEEKDIIQSIDEKELNTMNDLREYIYTKKPGDQVTLKIIRKKISCRKRPKRSFRQLFCFLLYSR